MQSNVVHPDLLMELSTATSEVQNILANSDVNKATRPDNIPAKMGPGAFVPALYSVGLSINLVPTEPIKCH